MQEKHSVQPHKNQEGIALLITLLLMGVLLGISTALLAVTLKQFQLSGITFQSEKAFQAANAAMECANFYLTPKAGDSIFFDAAVVTKTRIPAGAFFCFNQANAIDEVGGTVGSEYDADDEDFNEQRFQFTWGTGSDKVCSEFSVYIFHNPQVGGVDASEAIDVIVHGSLPLRNDCPEGGTCSVVEARGYNVACEDMDAGGRVVEREFIVVY